MADKRLKLSAEIDSAALEASIKKAVDSLKKELEGLGTASFGKSLSKQLKDAIKSGLEDGLKSGLEGSVKQMSSSLKGAVSKAVKDVQPGGRSSTSFRSDIGMQSRSDSQRLRDHEFRQKKEIADYSKKVNVESALKESKEVERENITKRRQEVDLHKQHTRQKFKIEEEELKRNPLIKRMERVMKMSGGEAVSPIFGATPREAGAQRAYHESLSGGASGGGGFSGANIRSMFRAGGMGVGATALAAVPGEMLEQMRGVRQVTAQRQFAGTEALMSGDVLGSAVIQSGVQDTTAGVGGALKGGAGGAAAGALTGAAIGSFVPIIGTAIGAALGGLVGAGFGGTKGYNQGLLGEAETRKAETAPLLSMVRNAQNLTPSRVNLMAGGGFGSENLTQLQGVGTSSGYGLQETLQQLSTGRSALGNQFFTEQTKTDSGIENTGALRFQRMQNLQRNLGVDIGTQSQFIQAAGVGGLSPSQAETKQVDVMRKAVMLGLDASKSGKFLSETSDFIRSNMGLGRLDADQVSGRLAGFAQTLGGPEGVNNDFIRAQARSLVEAQRQVSGAEGGLAAGGNAIATLQAAEETGTYLSAFQIMNLGRTSSKAKAEDIKSIVPGASDEFVSKFLQSKQGTAGLGVVRGVVGGEDGRQLEALTFGRMTGQFAEQAFRGVEALRQGPGNVTVPGTGFDKLSAGDGIKDTEDYKDLEARAKLEQGQFVEGFKNLTDATEAASVGLSRLAEDAEKARKALSEFLNKDSQKTPGGGGLEVDLFGGGL